MEHTSLFSGIGGFELGIKLCGADIKTTQFVEIDKNAIAVLNYRFPNIPVHADIRDFFPKGNSDLFTIGFPCTGTSSAGNRSGLLHAESSLWFEALRCINAVKPRFIIVEQPSGVINQGLRAILGGLRMAGYHFEVEAIALNLFGSPQKRERIFIVAYTDNILEGFRELPTCWSNQIRAEVESIHRPKGEIKSRDTRMDDGVPIWLGGINVAGWWKDNISTTPHYPGVRAYMPGRRECNDLYARSVCPMQAAIAIKRVLYLNSLTAG
jgi:DNA (cytosine-5)-methyltransferase 1